MAALSPAAPIPHGLAAVPDATAFRNGMAHLASAVSIITTDGPAGRFGFTASALCSVTDSPPTLLVCVNTKVAALEPLLANGVLCVNLLEAGQRDLSQRFGGGQTPEERFAGIGWVPAPSGAPRLPDALVSFDTRISSSVDQGTHKVLFCAVTAITLSEHRDALVYFRRAYHGLNALA